VKPALLINIEEVLRSNIDEIILVVQPSDLPCFETLFKQEVPPENFHNLDAEAQKLAKHILEIGKKVKFVVQQNQEGLGHAVLAVRDHVGEEPFLLMLGHHLYKSNSPDGVGCCAQVFWLQCTLL
jgi:UTP--glucose-1-phosphate uridylyltransferase